MALHLAAACIGVPDPAPVAQFWADLLDRPLLPGPTGFDVPG
ncbi:hypothetical protein [Ornithinicoccus hortensis]|nr:hypothetical protein [Ornithinicoccus hortensis]